MSFSIYSTFIHRQYSSIPQATLNKNNAELTRNQLDDLKKKLTPVQQIILSLRPKEKYSLIGYIPDFEAYDQDINTNNDQISSPFASETYDNEMEDSLSDRLYKELDGSTISNYFHIHSSFFLSFRICLFFLPFLGRSTTSTRKPPRQAPTSNVPSLASHMRLYLILFILHQFSFLY